MGDEVDDDGDGATGDDDDDDGDGAAGYDGDSDGDGNRQRQRRGQRRQLINVQQG